MPVLAGEPEALSLMTKLEQNVLERERQREERLRHVMREHIQARNTTHSQAILPGPESCLRR